MSGSDLRPGLLRSCVPSSGPSSSSSSSWVAGNARFLLRLPPGHSTLSAETEKHPLLRGGLVAQSVALPIDGQDSGSSKTLPCDVDTFVISG